MTSRRMRRLAALTMIGMALSACADGDGMPRADAPEADRAGSSGEPPASSQPGAAAAGGAGADFGLPEVAGALGVATPSTPGGTPGAPSGHAAGAPFPGSSAGGTTAGGAAAPTQSGVADTGSASGDSSAAPSGGPGPPRPKIHATPEDCAMLAQVMAIVDHPQLHQLKADTGC